MLLTQATALGTSMSSLFRAVETLDDPARQGSNGFMKALASAAEIEGLLGRHRGCWSWGPPGGCTF